MSPIDLPRALEEYFAFAETDPTRRGRRFSITLPLIVGNRLDRLQWWYHISPAQELMFDGHAVQVYRERAAEGFRRHIERWLEINRRRLHGDGPIPRLSALPGAPSQDSLGNDTASFPDATPQSVEILS